MTGAGQPFAGRSALVAGAGVAGVPAAEALMRQGASVQIVDGRSETPHRLAALGLAVQPVPDAVPAATDLVIASPGFPPSHPLLRDAVARGVPVFGEMELAWRLRRAEGAPWLLVTGTNGKTTVTGMTAAMLAAAGRRVRAVGNIGASVIDAVTDDEDDDVLVVEISSQQLHFTETVAPLAAVLLNVAPDHLTWHGGYEAYVAAKVRVWERSRFAVGNRDDATVNAALPAATGQQVGFTVAEPRAGELGVVAGALVDRAFARGVAFFDAAEVEPPGRHNVANALAATALSRAVGIDLDDAAAGLRAFRPAPHRNARVAVLDDVTWVDDSKATNPHAAAASLHSYEPIVWIAGGQLKGVNVEPLVAEIAERLRAVVLLGVDRAQIAAALARHAPDIPVVDVPNTDDKAMSSVVAAAAELARPGDTVLLAPAAASYDMYRNYGHRGDEFIAAVRARQ